MIGCLRCGLDAEHCRCTRLERTLEEERYEAELAERRRVHAITTALRGWGHLQIELGWDRPLEQNRAAAWPFLCAAAELDGRPLACWCAEYLVPVERVLERELLERRAGKRWSVLFARVPVEDLERAIVTLRERAKPLYESRREAAE